jgi:hypothetical protein
MTRSEAIQNADWIAQRLHPFSSHDVGSVIPTGFAAYARILHPAAGGSSPQPIEVRWSDVAQWSRKVIHPLVQFRALVPSPPRPEWGPEPFTNAPQDGVLPEGQVRTLATLLSQHTTTKDRCWYCLWEGFGYFSDGGHTEFRAYKNSLAGRWARWRHEHMNLRRRRPKHRRISTGRVTPNPERSYFLFSGSVMQAAGWEDGPNLWWPDDRAWCVASEIDLAYTYVGGSRKLIDQILELPSLESLPCELGDRVTYDSDRINSAT